MPKVGAMTYIKTEAGQQAFKERSAALSVKQRAAFIVFDGKRSVEQVIRATQGMGITAADIDHLLALGFLAPVQEEARAAATPHESEAAAAVSEPGSVTAQELYDRAYPIAAQLTASLGLRGFRLNLAVEAAYGYEGLVELFPRIREAVGDAKCELLAQALDL